MTEEEWNSYEAALKHEWDASAIEEQKLMDAEEKGLKKGLEKGLEKGISEGEKIKAIEIARNLKSMNLSIEQIKAATNLTEEEIFEIK